MYSKVPAAEPEGWKYVLEKSNLTLGNLFQLTTQRDFYTTSAPCHITHSIYYSTRTASPLWRN